MSLAVADGLVAEANELFRTEAFAEAAVRFERATRVFPQLALAWKGLGHSLLCLGRAHEAARAFDRAIGLRPDSATALWGGAVAHAEIGNNVVAQSYLRRTLALQPTWIEMARGLPQMQQFLQISSRTAEILRGVFGAFSTRTYKHTGNSARSIEVGRVPHQPRFGQVTFVTIGLSNHIWDPKPRVELVMASHTDNDVCGQILANLAFHLMDTNFYPDPNVMVRDVVGALGAGDLSLRLPHVFVGTPRGWEMRLPLDTTPPGLTLAQAIPVSEPEYALWRANVSGFDASFASRRVDIADLRRLG
jgi:tetratricopeptide (TPR) repeat protein